MSDQVSQRQYAIDQGVSARRANPPRDVSYNEDLGELSWLPPLGSNPWTHYNIRVNDDSGPPKFQVPDGTARAVILTKGLVTITAWNEISGTESEPVYYTIVNGWKGGSGGGGAAGTPPSIWDFIPPQYWDSIHDGTINIDLSGWVQEAIDAVRDENGGVLHAPWGTYPIKDIDLHPFVILSGDGMGKTIFKRFATLPPNRGMFNITGAFAEMRDLALDGQVIVPMKLAYASATDPMQANLVQDTSIWIKVATDVSFERVRIFHTGGRATILDSRTGDISRVRFQSCVLHDNRPHLFGPDLANAIYGSWTGGIHMQGDGASFAVRDCHIDDCRFRRSTGHQIQSHVYGFGRFHSNIKVTNCTFLDVGRRGVLLSAVSGGVVSGNHFRRIGYVCETDAVAGVPRWIANQFAVALDTDGIGRGVNYEDNSFLNCLGGAIGGDGLSDCSISGNTARVSLSNEPEYGEDAVASWPANYCFGIQTNNSAAQTAGARGIVITGNQFFNLGLGAIRLFAARKSAAHGNIIYSPDVPLSPPITLGNIQTTDNERAWDNVVANNTIYYNPPTAQPAIFEDATMGAFKSTDINWVSQNRIFGSLGLAYEFGKNATTASLTGLMLSSNQSGLTARSFNFIQREAAYLRIFSGGATSDTLLTLLDRHPITEAGAGIVGGPLMNVSLNAAGGAISTGGRSTLPIDDVVATGVGAIDQFLSLSVATTFPDAKANLLPATYGLMRYDPSAKKFQISTAGGAGAGVRVWSDLGSSTPGGGAGTIPGLIVITSASYSYLDAEQVEILIYFTPPVVTGAQVGAHVWEESPDVSTAAQAPMNGTAAMDGTKNSGGAWNPIDKGKFLVSPLSIVIPAQPVTYNARYYLASYTETAEAVLVQANQAGSTTNALLTIEPPKYQIGVEYAWQVTNCSVTVEYDDNQVSSPKYALRFQWTPPADRPAVWMRKFGYCCIVYEYDEANRQSAGPEMGVSQTNTLSPWYDLFPGTSVIKCWFVSEDNSDEPKRNSIVPNVTPYVNATVVFPIPARPASGKYADNVTGFAVTSGGYDKGIDGQRVYKINWSWAKPVGVDALARWGGAVIYSTKPSKPGQVIARTGPELGIAGTMEFPDLPLSAETWTFIAISRDNNANPNTDQANPVAGTPTATLAVTAAPVDVAPVTGFAVTPPYYDFNGQGVKSLLCVPYFTRPTDPAWAYINFYATVAGSVDGNGVLLRYPLGSPIEGGVPGTAYIQDFPVVAEVWNFRAYSVDVNGRESPTYVSHGPFTVGPPPVDPKAVTGFTVTTPYYEDNGEGPAYLVIVPNFTKPTGDPNWSYANFYAEIQEEGTKLWGLNAPVVGGVGEAAIVTDFPAVNQNWAFWLYSVDIYGKEAPTGLRFPASGWMTVGPPPNDVKPSGGFSVTNRYEVNGTGQKTLILVPTFTKPSDVTWAYSNLYKEVKPTSTKEFLSAPAASGESAKTSDYPKVSQEWAFYLASVDIYGKEAPLATWVRYPAAGTWTVIPPPLEDSLGQEWALNCPGTNITATSATDSNGVLIYTVEATFTKPVDVRWGGAELRLYDSSGTVLKASMKGSSSPIKFTYPSPSTSTTFLAYLVSYDVNGKMNTVTAGTPGAGLSMGNAAGTLDMTKVAAASALDLYIGPSGKIEIKPDAVDSIEIKDDAIKAPKIFANAVLADKIAANAVIAEKIMADAVTAEKILASAVTTAKLDTNGITVGGGSGMAGVVTVVNASSQPVAELGRLTTVANPPSVPTPPIVHGGWFKVFGAGGNNYTTAKVFTDVNGNVTVKDVTFTITHSTTQTEIFTEPTFFDPSFGSIVLSVRSTASTGPRAWHMSKGFVTRMGQDWQTGSLNTMASFDRCGEMVLYQPNTMAGQSALNRISIWANGSDGSIRAFAYNILKLNATNQQTEVFFGQTGNYTDPAGKTMVFQNGILIGKGGW